MKNADKAFPSDFVNTDDFKLVTSRTTRSTAVSSLDASSDNNSLISNKQQQQQQQQQKKQISTTDTTSTSTVLLVGSSNQGFERTMKKHDNMSNYKNNNNNNVDNDVIGTATADGHIPVVVVSKPSTLLSNSNKTNSNTNNHDDDDDDDDDSNDFNDFDIEAAVAAEDTQIPVVVVSKPEVVHLLTYDGSEQSWYQNQNKFEDMAAVVHNKNSFDVLDNNDDDDDDDDDAKDGFDCFCLNTCNTTPFG